VFSRPFSVYDEFQTGHAQALLIRGLELVAFGFGGVAARWLQP
jgi:hypothetical protein